MIITVFDGECRYWIHPYVKFLTTLGGIIILSLLGDCIWGLVGGGIYIVVLLCFFRIRVKRFVSIAFKMMKGFALLFTILILVRYIILGSVDIEVIIHTILFFEILIIGLVFASITSTGDYIMAFGESEIVRGITYAYRGTMRIFEDLLDEISVIRSRKVGLLKVIPPLFIKYLLEQIRRAMIFDENCRLKGTKPWPTTLSPE